MATTFSGAFMASGQGMGAGAGFPAPLTDVRRPGVGFSDHASATITQPPPISSFHTGVGGSGSVTAGNGASGGGGGRNCSVSNKSNSSPSTRPGMMSSVSQLRRQIRNELATARRQAATVSGSGMGVTTRVGGGESRHDGGVSMLPSTTDMIDSSSTHASLSFGGDSLSRSSPHWGNAHGGGEGGEGGVTVDAGATQPGDSAACAHGAMGGEVVGGGNIMQTRSTPPPPPPLHVMSAMRARGDMHSSHTEPPAQDLVHMLPPLAHVLRDFIRVELASLYHARIIRSRAEVRARMELLGKLGLLPHHIETRLAERLAQLVVATRESSGGGGSGSGGGSRAPPPPVPRSSIVTLCSYADGVDSRGAGVVTKAAYALPPPQSTSSSPPVRDAHPLDVSSTAPMVHASTPSDMNTWTTPQSAAPSSVGHASASGPSHAPFAATSLPIHINSMCSTIVRTEQPSNASSSEGAGGTRKGSGSSSGGVTKKRGGTITSGGKPFLASKADTLVGGVASGFAAVDVSGGRTVLEAGYSPAFIQLRLRQILEDELVRVVRVLQNGDNSVDALAIAPRASMFDEAGNLVNASASPLLFM